MSTEDASNAQHSSPVAAASMGVERKTAWPLVVLFFTLIALWPIWSVRFPPIQDYPVHLLHVKMLQHFDDPQFTYNQYFDFRIWPMYAMFFVVTKFYASLMPIEVAGKLFLSSYVLVIALLVLRIARKLDFTPWGLLLFFPFAFNQQYFFGFTNYMFSIPLLLFALIDHDDLIEGAGSVWAMGRHVLWQLAILLTHPFTFLVYVGFLCVNTCLILRGPIPRKRSILIPFVSCLPLTVWILLTYRSQGGTDVPVTSILWKPFVQNLSFYGSMFTGMRLYNGRPDLASAGLWIVCAAITAGTLMMRRPKRARVPNRFVIYFLLATVVVFICPFAKGFYTFINWRVSGVSYFLLALLVGHIHYRKAWGTAFVAVVAGLMIVSANTQRRVSAEIAEIEPIIDAMPTDARFLPLIFDNNSPALDSFFFDPHLHVEAYYHLRHGNGFSPYGLDAPLHPVRFKPDVDRPGPNNYKPHRFRWELHADDYDYFLVRSGPPEFFQYVKSRTEQISTSGQWQLLKRINRSRPVTSDDGPD